MQTYEPLAVTDPASAQAADVVDYLLRDRPEAALQLELAGAQIIVVAAKRPGQPWDEVAREHIALARASYRLWGEVPVWDHFDALDSTSQYIGYVVYRTADGRLEREAITGRLVREQPEDLSFYAVGGRPLGEVLAERLDGSVAGDSRIGALRPRHARCNAYTLAAFAAVRLAMMSEARSNGEMYVACQLRPSLVTRVLSRGEVRFGFPRTEVLLQLPHGVVRLNRANACVLHHIFTYPGYFLDSESLRRGLDLDTLPCDPSELQRLCAAMRPRIIEDVADGVYSSVFPAADYQTRAMRVLQQLGATLR